MTTENLEALLHYKIAIVKADIIQTRQDNIALAKELQRTAAKIKELAPYAKSTPKSAPYSPIPRAVF